MPIHDWSRVDAGIFHHFHLAWIDEIQRSLNNQLLPEDCYALAEQQAGLLGSDVLTLQSHLPTAEKSSSYSADPPIPDGNVLLAPPHVAVTAEADLEFYRRRQNRVVIRPASGDEIVAVGEIISRGNKSSGFAMHAFVDKTAGLLTTGIHLALIDLQPPTSRDPNGIHALLWHEMTSQVYNKPSKPLTLAAYEAGPAGAVRAYIQPVASGDRMPDMPLFLRPGAHVPLPLQATYDRAFEAIPRRWRRVLG